MVRVFELFILTVRNLGSYALVVFTNRNEGLVYSLPMLEYLHTLPLPTASSM